MSYLYNGQEVELVPGQQFDSHWNIYINRGDGLGNTIRQIISVDPKVLQGEPSTPSPKNSSPILEENSLLPINQASFLDIKNKFPGIGRIAAKTISENKPYQNFEELKRNNSKLNINWDLLKDNINYE